MPEPQALPTTLGKTNADLLDEITADFRRLQRQKSNGGKTNVEMRVLRALAFFYGEHYLAEGNQSVVVPTNDDNKLYLVFNVLAQRAEKFMGRVSNGALNGVFKANPNHRDPQAIANAEVVDNLTLALDQKLNQPALTWELLHWLVYGGVAFEHITWESCGKDVMPQVDPETGELLFTHIPTQNVVTKSDVEALIDSGEPQEHFELLETLQPVEDVVSTIYGPLSIFVDSAVKSLDKLPPDGAVYIATPRTRGWLLERYGYQPDGTPDEDAIAVVNGLGEQDTKIVTTELTQLGPSHGMVDISDLVPIIQGARLEGDPACFVVVERYQPSSIKYPRGRYTVFVPGAAILREGENPYGEIPLIDYHLKPVTTTFWNKDYTSDLIAPQKFLNKRMSQFGEHFNANVHGKILLGPTIKPSDLSPDAPQGIQNGIDSSGNRMVARMEVGDLPTTALDTAKMTLQLLNDLSGGSDLFQESKFPGQMRGSNAVPMLQEILDSEWANLYEHLGERMAKSKQMRLNRVRDFYPAHRTLNYVSKDMRDEVLEFYKGHIFKGGSTDYTVRVQRGSMIPELRALRESKLAQRLQSPLGVMYVDERTGALDKSKIAADLQFGEPGRESRIAQHRKLQISLNKKLMVGEPIPPVLPFWDHSAMMDELESVMATTEFLSASPDIQQGFLQRWQEHMNFVQQAAERQRQAFESQMVHGAVAQATQQAAAQAAAETVKAVTQQTLMQQAQQAETNQLTLAASQGLEGVSRGQR